MINNVNLICIVSKEMRAVNECHFGRNLKRWRLDRGITLRELERRTGLKRQYLFRIEQGLYKGTPNQWIRLFKELNVSIDKFTSDSDYVERRTCRISSLSDLEPKYLPRSNR